MQATGNMDRFWQQDLARKQNLNKDDTKIQNVNELGYENVAIPFVALLTGLLAAILHLGIESLVFYTRKYAGYANRSSEDFNS